MLSNATVLTGATISATGGSAVTFALSGKDVPDGVEIVDVGSTDYRTRTSISCRVKMPTYNAVTNTFTKGKRMITFVMPITLADGTMSYPVVRIEVEDHPEQTAAHRLDMRKMAAQILTDSDFDQYYLTGSKA